MIRTPEAPAGRAVPAAAPYRRSLWVRTRALRTGLLFTSPWIVGILCFILYPTGASFYYSLTQYDLLQTPTFIGLDNYAQLLQDETVGIAIYNTLYYMVLWVPLNIALSIAVALLLNLKVRGMSIYRTLFYLPVLVPAVATSLLWVWFLNPQYGVANWLLSLVGLPGLGWLASTTWSKPSIVLISLWGSVGNTMLIFLASLQDIPRDLHDAAEVDGANAWQRFWSITLPLLTPVIFFELIIGIIAGIQFFTIPYVVTGGTGNPANSLTVFGLILYRAAFFNFKMGYASAMAWSATVIIFILTYILFRTSNRWVFYQSGEAR
ncbi:MAG: sugar ABC transporter permease [Chloroflexi bacterium]|nr:sugar ABC transporter permease [Chloroflexota bacterium]HLG51436.1 sugar ABC transporter permease [Chloroflexota bacterium]